MSLCDCDCSDPTTLDLPADCDCGCHDRSTPTVLEVLAQNGALIVFMDSRPL